MIFLAFHGILILYKVFIKWNSNKYSQSPYYYFMEVIFFMQLFSKLPSKSLKSLLCISMVCTAFTYMTLNPKKVEAAEGCNAQYNELMGMWQGVRANTSDTTYKLKGCVNAKVSTNTKLDRAGLYKYTAWYKYKKENRIDKAANNYTGTYRGFTQQKIEDYKKYENEIRQMNGGSYPTSPQSFPMDSNSPEIKFWMSKAGYYDVLIDQKVRNVTLEAFAEFNWEEEVVTETVQKTYSHHDFNYDETDEKAIVNLWEKVKKKYSLTGEMYDYFGAGNLGTWSWDTKDKDDKNVSYHAVLETTCADVHVCGNEYGKLTVTRTERKKKTVTESRSQKIQIASSTVASNAWATQLDKYKTFYLVPTGTGSRTIATVEKGFWKNLNPPYFTTNIPVSDNGNYPYTWSNGVNSGLANVSVNLSSKLDSMDGFYTVHENIPDAVVKIPDDVCTDPGGCDNPPSVIPDDIDPFEPGPNDEDNPSPDNPNGGGGDNGNGGGNGGANHPDDAGRGTNGFENQPPVDADIGINSDSPYVYIGNRKVVHLTKDLKTGK